MSLLYAPITDHEETVMTRLNRELAAAGYPREYPVDMDTLQVIENYYARLQRLEPEGWYTWTRTGKGIFYRNCELTPIDPDLWVDIGL